MIVNTQNMLLLILKINKKIIRIKTYKTKHILLLGIKYI